MQAAPLFRSPAVKLRTSPWIRALSLLVVLGGGLAHAASSQAVSRSSPSSLASLLPTMCARVHGTAGFQRAFCAAGNVGATCVGDVTRTCTDDGSTLHPRWYQAAIDWAKANGHSRVVLDPGTITISEATKLAWSWPWGNGFGLHVPTGIHLEGTSLSPPTIINVDHDTTKLNGLIIVAGTGTEEGLLNDASVSNLTLVGTTNVGYSQGQECPARAHSLNSILELDGHEPPSPDATVFNTGTMPRRWTVGVQVNHAEAMNGPAVNVHHLRIVHLGAGIAYGWNTAHVKENPTCETTPGIKISIQPASATWNGPTNPVTYTCPSGWDLKALSRRPGTAECRPTSCNADGSIPSGQCPALPPLGEGETVPNTMYCMRVDPTTEFGTRRYCTNQPFEFRGNANARSQVHHNSICDVNVGINIVGGNVDVSKNVVLRAPHNVPLTSNFGLSTDGHMPYTSSTTHTENFVSGFSLGFLTDGSQYTVAPPCAFRQLTGFDVGDFGDYNHVLELQQHLLDDAQKYYALTEPMRGFIDHVYVRDNRFYKNPIGLTFYRVNWGFVGFNTIDSQLTGVKGQVGVLVDNTLNSWVYGNTIRDFSTSLEFRGSPGHQSTLGSCYNGNHVVCDAPGCPNWASYPNVFSGSDVVGGTACNVAYSANYCADPTSLPSPSFPVGVTRQCYSY
ncbi:hypothetical protein [Myxococcus llanfairpwllgwyngyllgogerychwyrndrobwllllantysiliogogogochensis]|nr:hypothetical protein [Myxococcus llanfairpwllgwyngyllgogerychwyrndrobwllllantysiliogogogochensis]